jgi:hypothetical protein
MLHKHRRGDGTVREFCIAEGLREPSFYFWRRELRARDGERLRAMESGSSRDGAAPAFVPVVVAREPSPANREVCLEVVLACGATLRIPSGFDHATLSSVLGMLERPRC